jgi:hypothetical protein
LYRNLPYNVVPLPIMFDEWTHMNIWVKLWELMFNAPKLIRKVA